MLFSCFNFDVALIFDTFEKSHSLRSFNSKKITQIKKSTYLNFGAKKWARNSVKFGLKNKKYMNFRAKIAKNTVNFGLKLHEFQNVKWNFYCFIIFGIRWICWWWCLKLVCIWLLCERQKKEPESSCHVKPSQWTPKCFCWLALLEKFYKAFTDKTAEQKQCS